MSPNGGEAIRDYLNNLASLTCVGHLPLHKLAGCSLKAGRGLDGAAVSLSYKKSSNMIYLAIHRLDYITKYLFLFLIVLFDNQRKNWITKIEKQSINYEN